MGAPTISPAARNTHAPPSMTMTRQERLIYVDGIERGLIWDGVEATMWKLGIEKPSAVPTLSSDAGGGSLTQDGTYSGGYRYLDRYLQPGDLSEFGTVTGPAADPTWRIDWSGLVASSNTDRIKYVELWRSLSGDSTVVYFIVRLGHHGTISSSANNGGTVRLTVPSGHNLAANARITISGHSVGGYNTTTTITAVTATTIDTAIVYSSNGTGGSWVIEGYIDDGTADTTLDDAEALAILDAENHLVARRFGVPPKFMSVAITFQDRTIYGVPMFYDKGTVATNGTTTLTGTGTDWNADMVDRYVRIVGESRLYRVSAYVSPTELTLEAAAANTASGLIYSIAPHTEFRNKHIISEVDEPESCRIDPSVTTYGTGNGFTNLVSVQENTSDAYDRETALMPFPTAYYSFRQRHIYEITFVRQPDIDFSSMCVGYRGCLNQRCWTIYEGIAYVLDEVGAYAFDGQSIVNLSDSIQNYWRDGNILHTNGKWFFVAADRQLGVIKFFVQFSTDVGTRPEQALCYHVRSKTWWREYYPWEIGHACMAVMAGVTRLLVGAESDKIYVTNEGNLDVATTINYSWKSGMLPLVRTKDHLHLRREVVVYYQPTTGAHTLYSQVYADRNVNAESAPVNQNLGGGFQITKDTSLWALDAKLARTVQGQSKNAPGYAWYPFGGTTQDNTYAVGSVAIALQGIQTTSDNIKIYRIDVWGSGEVDQDV